MEAGKGVWFGFSLKNPQRKEGEEGGDSLAAKCPSSLVTSKKQNKTKAQGDAAQTRSPSLKTSVATAPGRDRRRTRFTTQAIVKLVPQAFDGLSLKYMYRNWAPLFIMSLRSLLFGHSGWGFQDLATSGCRVGQQL